MSKTENSKAEGKTAKAARATLSVSLTPELIEKIGEERWTLKQASISGVLRHIVEDYFSRK